MSVLPTRNTTISPSRRVGAEWVYLTKGDNVLHPDALVPGSEVIGRVIAFRRGEIWKDLDNPAWRVLRRGIAAAMLLQTGAYLAARKVKRRLMRILS